MNVSFHNTKLSIDIEELVENLPDEALEVVYQRAAFDEKLLKACMDYLVDDYAFEDGYFSTTYGTTISRLGDRLKERCLPLMDKASQHLINNLKADYEYACKRSEELLRENGDLKERVWRQERRIAELKAKDNANDPTRS